MIQKNINMLLMNIMRNKGSVMKNDKENTTVVVILFFVLFIISVLGIIQAGERNIQTNERNYVNIVVCKDDNCTIKYSTELKLNHNYTCIKIDKEIKITDQSEKKIEC